MFYYYLTQYIDSFNFLNLFNYLTFRAGGALFTAFFISLFLGPKFIKKLKSVQKNGQLIAGAVFHDYRDGQIEASIAASSPSWATRSVLYSLFAYPFNQCDANRLLVTCDESNDKAMKMNKQLGFTPEGILRQMYYPNDAIVWGMLKDECKWITKKELKYG